MAVGLLRHSEEYALPPGFYGLSSVMVLLALMALARIASIEQFALPGGGGNGETCWDWTGFRKCARCARN